MPSVETADERRVRPERFVAGGDSIARDADGRVVFARGALPGEDVTVALIDDKNDWSRGVVTAVHEASPDRVEPPCPQRHLGCGGCDWQHLRTEMQLPAKLDIVVDALRRTGRLSAPEVRIGASVPPRGYRTTVRLVGDADGRPAFRLERAHETVAAAGCLIAHPGIASLLPSLRVTPGLEVTIRVSAATGEITARWDRHAGDVDGLPSGAGTGPKAFLTEHVGGVPFRVSAGSFFQSGPAGAALLVDAVRRAAPELESATTVLDAYAGVGLFAKAAAREASRLLTVETSRSAVSDCTHNLAGRHVRIERGEFGAWRPAASERIDVAIANPARSGLGRPGVGSVAATEAPVVALVSCDPVALARDAALLAKHGFRHAGSEVLDLFPHTHHVETVTRFVRV